MIYIGGDRDNLYFLASLWCSSFTKYKGHLNKIVSQLINHKDNILKYERKFMVMLL